MPCVSQICTFYDAIPANDYFIARLSPAIPFDGHQIGHQMRDQFATLSTLLYTILNNNKYNNHKIASPWAIIFSKSMNCVYSNFNPLANTREIFD